MQGEYKGDFTKDTFNPHKHFSRVLMQQGRVQLDADWNEQTNIQRHYLQSLAADLIGPHGGADDGFDIVVPNPASGAFPKGDFQITPGHYYVDGILCENENPVLTVVPVRNSEGSITTQVQVISGYGEQPISDLDGAYVEFSIDNFQTVTVCNVAVVKGSVLNLDLALGTATLPTTSFLLRRITSFTEQPDLSGTKPLTLPGPYLVYLDVWERHLSSLQDYSIREVALEGPDTTSRAKVVWQIKATKDNIPDFSGAASKVDPVWRQYVLEHLELPNRGLLKARLNPQNPVAGPCIISPESRYRGAENHLYRVEIHQGTDPLSGASPSFKWSRENGAVTFPILELAANTSSKQTTVTLSSLGPDDRLGLAQGDWVEVLNDDYILLNLAGPLLRVSSLSRDNFSVILDGVPSFDIGQNPAKHPLLRRWDQKPGDKNIDGLTLQPDGTVLIPLQGTGSNGSPWLTLEDGIQIQFQASPEPAYRTGDYWLIPARVATGDIEWPRLVDSQGQIVIDPTTKQPIPDAVPPHGIQHHYAPLAVVQSPGITPVDTTPRRTIKAAAQ